MRLLKEFLIYGVSGAVSKIIMVFLVPLYTRILTTEEYGVVGLAATIMGVLNIACDLQITSAMGRYYYEAESEHERRRLVGAGFLTVLGLSILVAAGVAGASGQLSMWLFSTAAHSGVFVLTALQLPLSVGYAYLLYLLRLARRPGPYLACSMAATLGTAVVSLVLVWGLRWGVNGVLWGQLAGAGLAMGACVTCTFRDLAWAWEWARVRKMLRFGVPSLPAVVGAWLHAALGQFYLLSYLTLSDVGIFSLSLRLASVMNLYQTAYGLAWFPFAMSRMKALDRDRQYALGLLVYLLAGAAIAIPLVLLGDEIVGIIAGPGFHDAARTFGLVTLAFLAEGVVIAGSLGIMVRERTVHYSISYGVSVVANVIVVALTMGRWGSYSAALGLLIGRSVHAAIVVAISQRLLPVPHHWRMIMAVLAMAFGALVLAQAMPSLGVWPRVLLAAAALLALARMAVASLPVELTSRWLPWAWMKRRTLA